MFKQKIIHEMQEEIKQLKEELKSCKKQLEYDKWYFSILFSSKTLKKEIDFEKMEKLRAKEIEVD